MVPSKQKSQDTTGKSHINPDNYLERKYGKEPKISTKELKQLQWNWH